jgi:hypothetical protein
MRLDSIQMDGATVKISVTLLYKKSQFVDKVLCMCVLWF